MILNELLSRPLIKIYQDPNMFNFSLDSILLADFVVLKKGVRKVIDLGTGNAPIPLYLSFKDSRLNITAVEIQEESYKMALENLKINNKLNINLIHTDLRGINQSLSEKFDVVISNPPFFKVGSNQLNPNLMKQIARHEVYLTLEELVCEASLLLKDYGSFFMIHRPDRLDEIFTLFLKYNLAPKRIRFVHPYIFSPAKHLLIEGVKRGNIGSLKVLKPLIIRENNEFSDEIKEIYYGRGINDSEEL